MAQIERGALVRYHGSLIAEHGIYCYDGLCLCELTDDFDDGCDDEYPNRHQLARMDHTRAGLIHVRRGSFTPLTESTTDATPKE